MEGYLTLSGEFLVEHKDRMVTLHRKGSRQVANATSATASFGWSRRGIKLVVETTTEKLAQHLGRTIHKAYKGDLSFQWSEPNPFVRVYWAR